MSDEHVSMIIDKAVQSLLEDKLSSFVDAQCKQAILADPETPEDLFRNGFHRGYSRAVVDVLVGRLQIRLLKVD